MAFVVRGDLLGAPLTVIQSVATLRVGGAEQMVSLLARLLHERDVRVRVLALADGPLRAPLDRAGIPCDVLPIASKWDVAAFRRVCAYLEQHPADVVHTHCPRTRLFVGMLARRGRTRVPAVVTTFHTLWSIERDGMGRAWPLQLPVDRLVSRASADACVAVTAQIRDEAGRQRGMAPERLRVIYNAIDPARVAAACGQLANHRFDFGVDGLGVAVSCGGAAEPARSATPPVIVALGRLVPPKGHRVLIEALPHVRARVPEVKAIIIGDGPLRAELEQLAVRVGVSACVTFAGEVLDPAPRLASGDLFVYPSIKGAFGLAGLEAMACGVPVVASHLDATPEFVRPNVTGVLVPPGDPRALAEAIVALLLDPVRRQTLASAARVDVAERFGVDRFVHEHLALYRALIISRRRRMGQHRCSHQIRTHAGTTPLG